MKPKAGIRMEIVHLDNQSASVNCSWAGSGTVNLTWFVDGATVDANIVAHDEDGSNALITLVWDSMEKLPGDTISISCRGQSAGNSNNTGAWASISEIMETITVPGKDTIVDDDSSEESDESPESNEEEEE